MDFVLNSKNLLLKFEEYLAIGFDVDHCLTRYKIKNLSQLIYHSSIEILQSEFNYPQETFQNSSKHQILNFGMSYLAIDVKKGNILKLGISYKILKAYNGTELLTTLQLKEIYGEELFLKGLDPLIHNRKGDFFICMSLFEHVWAILFAQTVQFKKTFGLWKDKNHSQIQEELNETYDKLFVFWNYKGKAYEMKSFSAFYKDVYENVEKYIYQQEELKIILKFLKMKGKFLFIASNSPYSYVKLTLDYSLGKDWENLFDLVVSNSCKPDFFINYSKPFYELDQEKGNFRGLPLNPNNFKHVVEGNIKYLDDLINYITGNIHGRKVFIGDNLISDNYYCCKFKNWDSINLLEELQELNSGKMVGGLDYQEYWGNFFYEEIEGRKYETFWPDFIRKSSSSCFPLLLSQEFKEFVNYK